MTAGSEGGRRNAYKAGVDGQSIFGVMLQKRKCNRKKKGGGRRGRLGINAENAGCNPLWGLVP